MKSKGGYAIITVSDGVNAATRQDISGDLIRETMDAAGWELAQHSTVPDDATRITKELRALSRNKKAEVVLTTGGTGLTARDVTPQATLEVVEYQVPGISEALRSASLFKTPLAMLSRAVAGVASKTLIINLPGSPKAVRETLSVVLPVLEHAVQLLNERQTWRHPQT